MDLKEAISFKLPDNLPPEKKFRDGIRRAPNRGLNLNQSEIVTAMKNALRYIPDHLHDEIIPEFLEELITTGRIYGYRYRPGEELSGKPVDSYKGKTIEGKAFQV
ncbi:MAG: urocanate hydratase, partial [Candidatus Aminicenantes bacterium]|nr:urocanate hydratase [Candidatus Aminicenantes bacterium]